MTIFVGIDEVGRGPLAGPVSVGAVAIDKKSLAKLKGLLKVAKDSKKLSPAKRKKIFSKIQEAQDKNFLKFIVVSSSHAVIDKKGINFAIQFCIIKVLKKLKLNPAQTIVYLDGGLYAPKEFLKQKTIVKGDEKKKIISLASIVAKVTRDAFMSGLSKKYPEYGFQTHVGYGTRLHSKMIMKYGIAEIHRKSFCKRFIK